MGILSRLAAFRKRETQRSEETPQVSREALARVLNSGNGSRGSLSAAELGQSIATSLSTIETAVLAIDALAERLREAHELLADAARNPELGRRALLAGRYDDLRDEIDAIVGSASHNRVNLISGRLIEGRHASFSTALDLEGRAGVSLPVVNLTSSPEGLSLSPPRSAFAEDAEIHMITAEIDAARDRVLRVSEHYADHAVMMADRLSRLQIAAGSRIIAPVLPTGADAPQPAEPETAARAEKKSAPSLIDMGIEEVESKLRAINERIALKAEAQSADSPAPEPAAMADTPSDDAETE